MSQETYLRAAVIADCPHQSAGLICKVCFILPFIMSVDIELLVLQKNDIDLCKSLVMSFSFLAIAADTYKF